jgi:hypothetical protein
VATVASPDTAEAAIVAAGTINPEEFVTTSVLWTGGVSENAAVGGVKFAV